MLKPPLICLLATVFLCAVVVRLSAEELEAPNLVAPPIPSIMPQEPPDPDLLSPPPEIDIDWGSAGSREIVEQGEMSAGVAVPAPLAEPSIAPPPPPVVETLLPGEPDSLEVEQFIPTVEIWRNESVWPQIPSWRPNRLDRAYVTGSAPVALRAQFDPSVAGKNVYVFAGKGIILDSPDTALTVGPSGDCVVSAKLDEHFLESHIIFVCSGIATVLPVCRASQQRVEAQEALTGGGQ